MATTWCSSSTGNRRERNRSRIDELFAAVIQAVISDSTEEVDGFTKSSARSKRLRAVSSYESQCESSFCRFRRKILESIENGKQSCKDYVHDKQKHHSSSERRSSSKHNTDDTVSMGKKLLSQPIRTGESQDQIGEHHHRRDSTTNSKSRISSKQEWIATLKEMADPKNEMTSSSDLLDISHLDVQTTALPDEDLAVPSCSQGNETHSDSRSTAAEAAAAEPSADERDSTTRSKRRRKKRRSKASKCQQVLYNCHNCKSAVLIKDKSPNDQFRCLHCDYWTEVEPEFLKDQKMEPNFCKIA